MTLGRSAAGLIVAVAALMAVLRAFGAAPSNDRTSGADGADRVTRIAAPGRVEGRSETVEVGSGIDGLLVDLLVHEGDRLESGQPVARIECADLEREIESRRAGLEVLRQQRRQLLRGGREDEQREARARVAAAEAAVTQAQADLRRAGDLWAERVISRAEYDRFVTAEATARADLGAAEARRSVAARVPADDERRAADARIHEAAAAVEALVRRLERCLVRAPASGEVLRVHTWPGEPVSQLRGTPIVSIADTSRLRVRAEVDETDIGLVRTGARVTVTAPALGDAVLTGLVVERARQMGRKQVRSGDPADKRDRDVLDVIVELDEEASAHGLVVGQRVSVILER
ncbi:MAG: HlyD family secretion protein [Vicinamibacterales bacterium]